MRACATTAAVLADHTTSSNADPDSEKTGINGVGATFLSVFVTVDAGAGVVKAGMSTGDDGVKWRVEGVG